MSILAQWSVVYAYARIDKAKLASSTVIYTRAKNLFFFFFYVHYFILKHIKIDFAVGTN